MDTVGDRGWAAACSNRGSLRGHPPGRGGGAAAWYGAALPARAPRSWAEKVYPNLTYFNEVDKGGHFAAWEQPELFAAELRAAFRSLR